MLFSEYVFARVKHIYAALIDHPFNQELMAGTLVYDKFTYFLEQDCLYLKNFARCQEMIASRVEQKFVLSFLRFRDLSYAAEQKIIQQYLNDELKATALGHATRFYCNYLLRMCSVENYAIGIASVMPCFWLFHEIGHFIAKNSTPDNPYAPWINNYTSVESVQIAAEAISIFNEVALNVNNDIKQSMEDAFYRSCIHELHFFNDAYTSQLVTKRT